MDEIRLNKYIGDSGFCSRREADELIATERVTVNGVPAKMGMKVSLTDKVRVDGEILKLISKDNQKAQPRQMKRKVGKSKELRKSSLKRTPERQESKLAGITAAGRRSRARKTEKPETDVHSENEQPKPRSGAENAKKSPENPIRELKRPIGKPDVKKRS